VHVSSVRRQLETALFGVVNAAPIVLPEISRTAFIALSVARKSGFQSQGIS
jgi:hypothetical protein